VDVSGFPDFVPVESRLYGSALPTTERPEWTAADDFDRQVEEFSQDELAQMDQQFFDHGFIPAFA
jgi:hypothetical protein